MSCLGSEACCGWRLSGRQGSPGPWCCSLPQLSSVAFCLQYKLCKVRKIFVGTKGIPHLVTHDARTIRYPDPLIKVNDTVQIDLETGKITDFIKFDTGRSCIPCKTLYSSPPWRAVWKLNTNARHLCSKVERQWWQPWEEGCSLGHLHLELEEGFLPCAGSGRHLP